MATIQRTIVDKFLEELAKSDKFDSERIDHLRKLLTEAKAVKAEQLIELFNRPQRGGLA